MSNGSLSVLLGGLVLSVVVTACWMQEPIDPGRVAVADPERGQWLYRSNCARTCHPENAFQVRKVRDQRQLIAAVRKYYEKVVGDESNYTAQDVYDMASYLDRKHYKFPATTR